MDFLSLLGANTGLFDQRSIQCVAAPIFDFSGAAFTVPGKLERVITQLKYALSAFNGGSHLHITVAVSVNCTALQIFASGLDPKARYGRCVNRASNWWHRRPTEIFDTGIVVALGSGVSYANVAIRHTAARCCQLFSMPLNSCDHLPADFPNALRQRTIPASFNALNR